MSDLQSNTLTIRSAMPSDYDLCMAFDHAVSTDHVWQLQTDEGDGEQMITFRAARLPRSIKVPYPRSGEMLLNSWRMHSLFLVAEWEKHLPVGYICVRQEPTQETAWVSDFVVDGGARLNGVGSALLRAALQWAIEQNLRRLMVETQTKNYPSIHFLQKRGFVLAGYNEMYFPNQDIALFFGQTLG